jgi:hypothetical protein
MFSWSGIVDKTGGIERLMEAAGLNVINPWEVAQRL